MYYKKQKKTVEVRWCSDMSFINLISYHLWDMLDQNIKIFYLHFSTRIVMQTSLPFISQITQTSLCWGQNCKWFSMGHHVESVELHFSYCDVKITSFHFANHANIILFGSKLQSNFQWVTARKVLSFIFLIVM